LLNSITIVLRGEPTAVGRPRFTRNGVAYTPQKTRYALAALRIAAQQQLQGRPPLEGPLQLDFTAELKIPSSWSRRKQHRAVIGELLPACRPDWENLAKITDGLTGVVWRDDAQIVRAHVAKRYSLTPQIIVEVRLIGTPRDA
jgi:Holliday junction resolvase RusA-like endonuclease